MDEAAADFKGILARAMENGDGYDVEVDGQIVLEIRSPALSPRKTISLAEFFEELKEKWPDEDFAKDVADGMQWSRSQLARDPWED